MVLTHWGWDNMAAILQTTFPNVFFWKKKLDFFIQISLKFVQKGSINNKTLLVQIMAWYQSSDKTLSEPMMVYLTDVYMCHPASLG